ncbi:MAG: hypothetical protein ACE5HP_09655 [Gemmatimonadota bacterium]
MQVFFADDSATRGAREGMGKLIAFGGFFMPIEHLAAVETTVNEILEDTEVPLETEVKWSPPRGN